MPLQTSTSPPSSILSSLQSSATASKSSFLIVYASSVDGRMWCGDCRDAEALVNQKFAGAQDVATVAYAGIKEEWRTPENVWRLAPFKITALPTIVKVTSEGKMEKLVEADVYNQAKLDAFVGR